MTEDEWLACPVPGPMLDFLAGKISERKLRLFGCACCRGVWNLITDARSHRAVQIAERFADGLASEELRAGATRAASRAIPFIEPGDPEWYAKSAARWCVEEIGRVNRWDIRVPGSAEIAARLAGEDLRPCHLAVWLRDVVGNPFRPAAVDPRWWSGAGAIVAELARAIYDRRSFDVLPVLADALEGAGCHEPDILGHCRRPGRHVRGCWVLDLILGRG